MAGVLSSMVVSLLSNSELPLVEFGGSTLHTLLEVCSAHKDKVEIKCMGSVGGKHQQDQNFIYSSLAFGTLNHDRANVMCIIFS